MVGQFFLNKTMYKLGLCLCVRLCFKINLPKLLGYLQKLKIHEFAFACRFFDDVLNLFINYWFSKMFSLYLNYEN